MRLKKLFKLVSGILLYSILVLSLSNDILAKDKSKATILGTNYYSTSVTLPASVVDRISIVSSKMIQEKTTYDRHNHSNEDPSATYSRSGGSGATTGYLAVYSNGALVARGTSIDVEDYNLTGNVTIQIETSQYNWWWADYCNNCGALNDKKEGYRIYTVSSWKCVDVTYKPTIKDLDPVTTIEYGKNIITTDVAEYNSIQWQISSDGENWNDINATSGEFMGFNGQKLYFSPRSLQNNGWYIRCTATNDCGTSESNATRLDYDISTFVPHLTTDLTTMSLR